LIWCLMTIILGTCGCACAPISKTISSCTHVLEVTPLHLCLRLYDWDHQQWLIWALMKQLPIAQCSGFLAYWNTSYDKEEHLADDSYSSHHWIFCLTNFFPSFAISRSKHLSQTSQAYSNVVLMKVQLLYIIVKS
jgi:hypothetical protein